MSEEAVLRIGGRLRGGLAGTGRFCRPCRLGGVRVKARRPVAIGETQLDLGTVGCLGGALHRRAVTGGDKGEAPLEDALERVRLQQPSALVERRALPVKPQAHGVVKPRAKIAKLGGNLGKTPFGRAKPRTQISQPKRRRLQSLLQSSLKPGNGKIDRLRPALDHLCRIEKAALGGAKCLCRLLKPLRDAAPDPCLDLGDA